MTAPREAHCGRETCPCEHVTCFKGWRDDCANITSPCQKCFPIRHAALSAPTRAERDRRLRAQSIYQQWTGA